MSLVVFMSCSGEDGEIGPQGEQGIQGEEGEDGKAGIFFEDFEGRTISPFIEQSFVDEADWVIGSGQGNVINAGPVELLDDSLNYFVTEDVMDGQNAEFFIPINNTATALVKFDVQIQSEGGFDFLTWSLNGVPLNGISGTNTDGGYAGPFTFEFAVPAGQNEISFSYSKDFSVSIGDDQAIIDNISIVNFNTSTVARKSQELLAGVTLKSNASDVKKK